MPKASGKSKTKKAKPAKRKQTSAKPKLPAVSTAAQSDSDNPVAETKDVLEKVGQPESSSRGRRFRYDPAITTGVPLTVLFVGDIAHREFRAAIGTLQGSALFCHAADYAIAEARLRDWSPELLILGQRYPGEITTQEIEGLRAASPASVVLIIDGAACEGEGRSGVHHPGTWRLYWHQATQLLAAGIQQRAASRAAWWNREPEVIRLASAQTRGLLSGRVQPAKNEQGVALVCSHDPDLAATLAEMLALCGLQSIVIRSLDLDQLQGVRLVLLDAETPADISQLAKQIGRSTARLCPPVVVVSGTVRIEDFGFGDAVGAQPKFQVLGKPIDLPSLELAISAALATTPPVMA